MNLICFKFTLPLGCVKDLEFLSAAAVGEVYRVNRCTAVKIPIAEGEKEFKK
jgi:hypothetical protein